MEQVEQLELKKFKQTDKLTKAVLALTKRYEIADKKQISRDKLSMKDRLKDGLKNKLTDTFSLKNVGGILGMGAGTMIGDFLGDRHDKKMQAKKDEANDVLKATDFAKNNAKYNPESIADKTREEGVAHGVKLYEEQKRILLEIQKIEEEIKNAQDTGHGESAKEYHKNTIKELNLQLEIVRGNKRTKETSPTKEAPLSKTTEPTTKVEKETTSETTEKETTDSQLTVEEKIEAGHDTVNELVQIREFLMEQGDVVSATVEKLEADTGKQITLLEKESLVAGIKAGMDEELLKLNEEQLKALRELVASSKVSEEDKLEAKKKEPTAIEKLVEGKPGEKEKKGGILDNVMSVVDMFSKGPAGLLPNILKTAGKAVPALARGAAAVSGSIMAGGSSLVKGGATLANSGVTKLATVGQAAGGASKVGSIAAKGAGALGSIAKKAGPLGAALDVGMGVNDLLDGKAQEEMPSGWDVISPMKWGMYAGDKVNKGVEAATGGNSIGGWLADKLQDDPMAKMPPVVSKVGVTAREEQSRRLEETMRREARMDEQRKAAVESKTAAPTIVTNQTINTTKKSMVMAPPVRNFEPS